MPRSLGSCPVPIVASMCALSMSFACASEKMPMCRGLCHQKRGVRRWRTTYALWRFMCLYSYVWYKSTVLTCLYTYEDRIEPQRCTRNVTLPASAVGGGRSREGSSHRAGTWAPVEQNVTSGSPDRRELDSVIRVTPSFRLGAKDLEDRLARGGKLEHSDVHDGVNESENRIDGQFVSV